MSVGDVTRSNMSSYRSVDVTLAAPTSLARVNN